MGDGPAGVGDSGVSRGNRWLLTHDVRRGRWWVGSGDLRVLGFLGRPSGRTDVLSAAVQ